MLRQTRGNTDRQGNHERQPVLYPSLLLLKVIFLGDVDTVVAEYDRAFPNFRAYAADRVTGLGIGGIGFVDRNDRVNVDDPADLGVFLRRLEDHHSTEESLATLSGECDWHQAELVRFVRVAVVLPSRNSVLVAILDLSFATSEASMVLIDVGMMELVAVCQGK